MVSMISYLDRREQSPESRAGSFQKKGDGTSHARYCRELRLGKKKVTVATKRSLLILPGWGHL